MVAPPAATPQIQDSTLFGVAAIVVAVTGFVTAILNFVGLARRSRPRVVHKVRRPGRDSTLKIRRGEVLRVRVPAEEHERAQLWIELLLRLDDSETARLEAEERCRQLVAEAESRRRKRRRPRAAGGSSGA